MTERQNWIQDKFNFLKTHIRGKRLSNFSGFKSLARGASVSAVSAHDICRGSTEMDSMEIGMQSDTTRQPSVTSPSTVSGCSSVTQQVMDQFAQMKIMLSSFLGPRQEAARTAFCNYLASEVVALEDRDFQTFRNEAVKLLSGIQSRADDRSHQPQQTLQQTLSISSSTTSNICATDISTATANQHQLQGNTS